MPQHPRGRHGCLVEPPQNAASAPCAWGVPCASVYRQTQMQVSWLQLIAHHTMLAGTLFVGSKSNIIFFDLI